MTLSVAIRPEDAKLIASTAHRWQAENIVARIWQKDATVWADWPHAEIAHRLGWLDAPERSRNLLSQISELHAAARSEGITDVVLCGMGGSSLAPEVFASVLPAEGGSPRLTVMDSTHPAAVRAVDRAIDARTTWFIVASKSGGTIETISFLRFFLESAARSIPDPGSHFIAITDPGTNLETLARERGFRATIPADPDVGGRYSALTAFGLVPAGILGADVGALLDAAEQGAAVCGADVPLDENVGFTIGALLALRSAGGEDKAQFNATPPMDSIGVWIEQLLAESTGKHGLGIVPIDGGPLIEGSPAATVVAVGGGAGHAADIDIRVDEPYEVATVMFILEFAAAVAGEILGINPFDQPDVELAKGLAAEAMTGGLTSSGTIALNVSDPQWVDDFAAALGEHEPSYVSIQAYLPRDSTTVAQLETLRRIITTSLRVYVTTGFGPRFLHSTGQLHKGGPPGGVFLQITDGTGNELAVPETEYSFNELIKAQARGDRAALTERGRALIAVDIDDEAGEGLQSLIDQLEVALG